MKQPTIFFEVAAAIVAVFGLTSASTLAADLYIPDVPEIYDDASTAEGFYIGGTFGAQAVDVNVGTVDALNGNALLGGVFAGYSSEASGIVFGIEADAEASSFNMSVACPNVVWTCNAYINALGSLRGRVGVALDAVLIYGTAGVAVGSVGGSTTNGVNTFPDRQIRAGWTAGLGAEMTMDEHWFGRLEYRYTDLGSANMNFDVVYSDVSFRSHAIRAGVGYKF